MLLKRCFALSGLNGMGAINLAEWDAWIEWMEERKISWVKWSISSKDETVSMLPHDAALTGDWPADTLKPSGAYTRELLRRLNDPQTATTSVAGPAPKEMLLNGNLTNGTAGWELEQANGASARIACVKEGPDGQPALRMEVLKIADNPWCLQLHQTGLRIEKGKPYILSYWVKSNRDGSAKVSCMQNHEPWDHSTQEEIRVSTEWKQMRYPFIGAWDDDNARIGFTDLGADAGRIYWFANCSLAPKL
jgi:hypothetical protein